MDFAYKYPAFYLASLFRWLCYRRFRSSNPYEQEIAKGYCHRILQPVGPTEIIRPTQSRSGDYISYYGPCEGPSAEEQARKQRRFERYRFGRDFMPG